MNPGGRDVKGAWPAVDDEPGTTRAISVGGVELAVEEGGGGVPFLLLHGFPLGSAIFDPVRPGVSRVARLITPDLPGFGGSGPLPDPSLDATAKVMIGLLDELGVERAVLGGHSMGGYVALRMADLAGERVLGLVLIASRAAPDGVAAAANRRRAIEQIEAGESAAFVAGFVPRLLGVSTRQRAPRLLEELHELADGVAPATLIACQRAMLERPDSRPLLASLTVPVLVLAGAEDELIPRAEAEEMVGLAAAAQLAVLPGCGHTPSVERPVATAELIAAFLATNFANAGG